MSAAVLQIAGKRRPAAHHAPHPTVPAGNQPHTHTYTGWLPTTLYNILGFDIFPSSSSSSSCLFNSHGRCLSYPIAWLELIPSHSILEAAFVTAQSTQLQLQGFTCFLLLSPKPLAVCAIGLPLILFRHLLRAYLHHVSPAIVSWLCFSSY